eukprot:6193585-Pleurochrysis_carterae.AAC.2
MKVCPARSQALRYYPDHLSGSSDQGSRLPFSAFRASMSLSQPGSRIASSSSLLQQRSRLPSSALFHRCQRSLLRYFIRPRQRALPCSLPCTF